MPRAGRVRLAPFASGGEPPTIFPARWNEMTPPMFTLYNVFSNSCMGKEAEMANSYSANDLKNDVKDAARDTARDVKSGVNKLADEAKDAWNEATGNTTADKVKSAAADVKATAADLAATARDKGAEYVDAAREKGAEYVDRAREEADRLYRAGERKAGEVAQYAGDYYDEMSDMVRRKPAQALGIAAGVGFLVGLILARR